MSQLRLSTDGEGVPFNLRIVKGEGVPIALVPEGTPGATVVAVRRVDELGFYNIGHTQLAHKVGITEPKLRAVLWHLGMEDDSEYVKVIKLGSQRWKRYSRKALERLREEVPKLDLQEIWEEYMGKGVKKAG
ncbi:MAG: hypothetical protein M3285_00995 [Actinomycetota bacterium]|nr:hypothetical protein [Actinomycetota bacterium]MDQ3954112.1 hypothetical protein [Actinomycetota bacterium]